MTKVNHFTAFNYSLVHPVQLSLENEDLRVALKAGLSSEVQLFALKSPGLVLGVCYYDSCHMGISRCSENPHLCQVSVQLELVSELSDF